jgi:tRNA A37 methylthiotransferase MiaB
VLFDRGGRHPLQMVGRSPYLQPVHANASSDLLGAVVGVEVVSAQANSLSGRVVPAAPHLPAGHDLGSKTVEFCEASA